MPFSVRDAGAWKEVLATGFSVRNAGAWLGVKAAWVRDAGAWKQFFQSIVLSGGDGGIVTAIDGSSPYDSSVAIRFNTDGTVDTGSGIDGALSFSAAGVWIDPTSEASGNYSVRYTNRVGTSDFTTKAANEDIWTALSGARQWTMNHTTDGTFDFDCDFEVRDDVGSVDTGSSAWTFNISNQL